MGAEHVNCARAVNDRLYWKKKRHESNTNALLLRCCILRSPSSLLCYTCRFSFRLEDIVEKRPTNAPPAKLCRNNHCLPRLFHVMLSAVLPSVNCYST